MSDINVRKALISVSDKARLNELAEKLTGFNVELLSTGGTHSQLKEAGFPVTEVAEYTHFPEMMAGRVKTLHPRIHGGLLGRLDQDEAVMEEHGIDAIDLLIVNLYPFEQTVARHDCTLEEAIENIDIGGPAMVRSAAKNHARVAVVVDVHDYDRVLDELNKTGGALSAATRFDLAVKAFEHIARYDAAIANYLTAQQGDDLPRSLTQHMRRIAPMRYGENPHQQAAFYQDSSDAQGSVTAAQQLQGKALSFNNVADTDAALECVKSFEQPACVIVKHANPCGVAEADSIGQAYDRAFACDPTSAFGGIIAINRPLSAALASAINERQFVEVIIAPTVDDDARAVLAKKKNVRVLSAGSLANNALGFDFKRVNGGFLVQTRDERLLDEEAVKVVTKRAPTDEEYRDLIFAFKVAKFVKSNAIVYARDNQTIGVGAGQMSRVYSAIIAGIKAADEKLEVAGSVMASDAFFPFRDGIDAAARAGITAVVQPGGSMRDEEVIDAADEAGMAMLFTGMRHFRH